jgi:hypothetical protein
VLLQPDEETLDDPPGSVQVGVEQHQREVAVGGSRDDIGLAHVVADRARDVAHRIAAWSARIEEHEGEEVL